jgi:hypothetical protein
LTISHKSYIQQHDSWNCGPIACTVLHSLLLNSIENYGSLIDDRKKKYISNREYVESLTLNWFWLIFAVLRVFVSRNFDEQTRSFVEISTNKVLKSQF